MLLCFLCNNEFLRREGIYFFSSLLILSFHNDNTFSYYCDDGDGDEEDKT